MKSMTCTIRWIVMPAVLLLAPFGAWAGSQTDPSQARTIVRAAYFANGSLSTKTSDSANYPNGGGFEIAWKGLPYSGLYLSGQFSQDRSKYSSSSTYDNNGVVTGNYYASSQLDVSNNAVVALSWLFSLWPASNSPVQPRIDVGPTLLYSYTLTGGQEHTNSSSPENYSQVHSAKEKTYQSLGGGGALCTVGVDWWLSERVGLTFSTSYEAVWETGKQTSETRESNYDSYPPDPPVSSTTTRTTSGDVNQFIVRSLPVLAGVTVRF